MQTISAASPHLSRISGMYFHHTERLALFIDGANLYATAQALGFDIDYKKMLSLFRGKAHVTQARYYAALAENQAYSAVRTLADWLDYNGYTTTTKVTATETAPEPTSLSRRREVARIDIDLTVDVMRLAPDLDHVVLFTGDGDFRALVEAVQLMGRRVSVVSTAITEPAWVDDGLRRQADQFIDLNDLHIAIRQLRVPTRRRRLVAEPMLQSRPGQFRYAWPA
jgi:uncharacterized LabA/DUF88 family protein